MPPYLAGDTDEVEKPLFLRSLRFLGVPFWALARVLGKGPMCWYRLEVSLGRNSVTGTTWLRPSPAWQGSVYDTPVGRTRSTPLGASARHADVPNARISIRSITPTQVGGIAIRAEVGETNDTSLVATYDATASYVNCSVHFRQRKIINVYVNP